MDRYRREVDRAEKLQKFTGEKVRQLEAEENFEKIFERLKTASWSVPRGFSAESVRENRDSG